MIRIFSFVILVSVLAPAARRSFPGGLGLCSCWWHPATLWPPVTPALRLSLSGQTIWDQAGAPGAACDMSVFWGSLCGLRPLSLDSSVDHCLFVLHPSPVGRPLASHSLRMLTELVG